jgi:hypothetical protein
MAPTPGTLSLSEDERFKVGKAVEFHAFYRVYKATTRPANAA